MVSEHRMQFLPVAPGCSRQGFAEKVCRKGFCLFIPRSLARRGNWLFLERFWPMPPGDSGLEVSAIPCPGFMGSISKAKGLIRGWSFMSPSCKQPALPLFRDCMASFLHPVILDLGGGSRRKGPTPSWWNWKSLGCEFYNALWMILKHQQVEKLSQRSKESQKN